MKDVREEIEKHIPGLEVELLQLMEDLIGDLTSVPQPIEIKLYSDDEQQLRTLPAKVAETISKVRGVVEVKSGIIAAARFSRSQTKNRPQPFPAGEQTVAHRLVDRRWLDVLLRQISIQRPIDLLLPRFKIRF